ncbi:Glu-tRNA(Gln) amidotransferase GatDE subunit D, partial [Candidatus Micrarchaeota archaeon CG06_land_8_20_14_3_00_50_6]
VKVVMAPQTIFGRVNLNVYSAGRLLKEIGVIGDGCDFTPETALVKLMWVLGHEKKYAKVKKEMETNIAGEITERSLLIDE